MRELGKRNIELESYMIQIGAKTLKYEPRVTSDPDLDPLGLGEKRMMEESETSDSESSSDASEIHEVITSQRPIQGKSTAPTKKVGRKTQQRRRIRQKPIPNSEESFVHVEARRDPGNLRASIGGAEL